MLVSNLAFASMQEPFFAGERSNSILFSSDIDVNKFGNNLQKRNINLRKVEYNAPKAGEQARRAAILNGAQRLEKSANVTLSNNSWNGYTSTGRATIQSQNVAFNKPMSVDAYSHGDVSSSVFEEEMVTTGDAQYVGGFYGDGKEPAPLKDTLFGLLLCASAYIAIRRRF